MKFGKALNACFLVSALFLPTALYAQASDVVHQEVIVTAQKFSSAASKTPLAVSAINGEALIQNGFESISTLTSAIPNLQMDANGTATRISIRGVTSQDTTEKGDPSSAFMLDGIYLARSEAQNTSFFDVERIEVLRGPQGTLYGRNTTAGVINVISKTPSDEFELKLNGNFGNFNARSPGAVINLPISPNFSVRAATNFNLRDAFILNEQGTAYKMSNNRDDASFRLSALYQVNEALEVLLRADYSKINSINADIDAANFYIDPNAQNPVYYNSSSKAKRTLSFIPANGGRSVLQQYDTDNHTWGIGAEVNWELPWANISYLGSHRYFERNELGNIILSSQYGSRFIQDSDYSQNSHEIRLAENLEGKFGSQIGIYYFTETADVRFTLRDLQVIYLPPFFAFPQNPAINTNAAIFAQTNYQATDRISFTFGARYSKDIKSRYGFTSFQQEYDFNPANGDFHFLNAAKLASDSVTWRAGADFDISADSFIYGAIATGYKSGSFNDGCMAGSSFGGEICTFPTDDNLLFYKPETLTSYEIGLKTRFWQRRAYLEATMFYYDYQNLQLTGLAYDRFGGPFYTTTNAAKASIIGFELSGEMRTNSRAKISYALTMLDARYGTYSPDGIHDWSGLALDRTPPMTASLGYETTHPIASGNLIFRLNSRWSDSYYLSNTSSGLRFMVPSFTKTDFNIGFEPSNGNYNLQFFVKNTEDIVYPLTVGGGVAAPSEPRTIGFRWGMNF